MSQKERDRLKVLHEASKGLLTQKQAAEQLRVSERQARRLVQRFQKAGDESVVHRLRGRASNLRIDRDTEEQAVKLLRDRPVAASARHMQPSMSASGWGTRSAKTRCASG